jgi:hypothetical protein
MKRWGRDPETLVARLSSAPRSVTFAELRWVCERFFGEPRSHGSSHLVFRTGLRDPAIVNFQRAGKMAKAYQCRQVARAIRALRTEGRT